MGSLLISLICGGIGGLIYAFVEALNKKRDNRNKY